MSKAGHKTKRRKRTTNKPKTGLTVVDFLRRQVTNPDPRSHAEYLADMRAKQAAGKLANPATAALLDRLERAI
jgi:hypothetical protein